MDKEGVIWVKRRGKLRLVQLDLTPEIKVFCYMLDRSLSSFIVPSQKWHIEYFNFRCTVHLDQHGTIDCIHVPYQK